jgi:hypothetical protein
VPDLYTAEVLVTSQTQAELNKGARDGLRQVLARVSGSTEVEDHRLIASAIRNPSAYYYQYGFESTDKVLVVGEEEVPASLLRIAFEPSAVSRLLREAGFPVWGSNRPGVLVWIALSEDNQRRILVESDTSDIVESLNTNARYRGLPLLYPLLDLEDEARLSSAEVWGLFLDRVSVASLRYNPDVVLVGRAQQDVTGQWSGRWYYRIEDRWESIDNTAFSEEALVSRVVDQLADELAERFAVGSSRGNLSLRVEGIRDVSEYAAAVEYLESLAPVVESFVTEVDGDEIMFQLNTEGQIEQLLEIIGLDEKMVLISTNPLHYRWVSEQ